MDHDLFKYIICNRTKKQDQNIRSNWLIISGALKAHSEKNELDLINKYGLIHIIRQIDGLNYYRITKDLYQHLRDLFSKNDLEMLEKNGIYLMNSSLRTKFNKMLKLKNSKETIQIEHLNGGVKQLVDTIIKSKIFKIEELVELHRNESLCCYKLGSEREINEGTEPENIVLKS